MGYTVRGLNVGGTAIPRNTAIAFMITPRGYKCTVILGDQEGLVFILTVRTADCVIQEIENWNAKGV
jgi:hypothetical protein